MKEAGFDSNLGLSSSDGLCEPLVLYRNDIDGLRAIAVLTVVAFHFDLRTIAPGGFVGVDVFFVISGFLITRIIYGDISSGKYDIIDFYDRRMRRIFPALFLIFICCIAATYFLKLHSLAALTAKSLTASAFFVSNLFFYETYGYFDEAAELNPLLHTWSLSVEEQFYVLFPIFVFAMRRFTPIVRTASILAIAVGSVICSAWLVKTDVNGAFYLVQSRAWELMVGSFLANGILRPIADSLAAEIVAVVGLGMIVGSVLLLHDTSAFPGFAAIPACVGAASIIYSGSSSRTLVSQALGLWPVRFVGLISYSLYLWHWPVIVIYRYFREPSRVEKLGLVVCCIFLAALTWQFIEKPFRRKPHLLGSKTTLCVGGLLMIALSTVAMIGATVPFGSSRRDILVDFMNRDWAPLMREGTCFLTTKHDDLHFFDVSRCLNVRVGVPNVLILGDSHAADLWPGLNATFPNVNFLQATASGCRPSLKPVGAARCTKLINYVIQEFLPKSRVDMVILSARWQEADAEDVAMTAQALGVMADKVLVIGPIPEYRRPLPMLLAQSAEDIEQEYANGFRSPEIEPIDRSFSRLMARSKVEYLSLLNLLCNPQCKVLASRAPLEFDSGHLTGEGSTYLAPFILKSYGGHSENAVPTEKR
jgi:peptidoglycan/LPS O-acetylase OafA/YrhL